MLSPFNKKAPLPQAEGLFFVIYYFHFKTFIHLLPLNDYIMQLTSHIMPSESRTPVERERERERDSF